MNTCEVGTHRLPRQTWREHSEDLKASQTGQVFPLSHNIQALVTIPNSLYLHDNHLWWKVLVPFYRWENRDTRKLSASRGWDLKPILTQESACIAPTLLEKNEINPRRQRFTEIKPYTHRYPTAKGWKGMDVGLFFAMVLEKGSCFSVWGSSPVSRKWCSAPDQSGRPRIFKILLSGK